MQLPLHTWPATQALPHPPQLATSLMVLEQAMPHAIKGGGHEQPPFTQVCVPPHTLPHDPQLLASVLGFTHAPPHGAVPTGHCPVAAPAAPLLPATLDMPPVPTLVLPAVPVAAGVTASFAPVQLTAAMPAHSAQTAMNSQRSPAVLFVDMMCGNSSTRG
jgi:hypothetical protein